MKKSFMGGVLALCVGLSLEASASDFASVRVSLLASDDDLDTGDFGTAAHLGMHLRSPELASGLSADAEVSLLISANNTGGLGFRDNASYVRLAWRPSSWGEGEGLALTVLPLSSTRLHLGYEYPATWGRTVYAGFTGTGSSPFNGVPGLEARLTREHWYAFVAAKSSLDFNELSRESERLVLGMAGAGVDVLPFLRLEAAGALAQHGVIPGRAQFGIEERASTRALSGRILFHQGAPIGPGVDLSLYRQDPELFEKVLAPESYPGGVSTSVSLEASHLAQTLADSLRSEGTVGQGADVLALQARLKVDFLRVHALALYRSASFVSSEVPGLPPYNAFTPDTTTQPELLLSAGVDHHFQGPGLTPGLVLRAVWPATFDTPGLFGGNNPPPSLTSGITLLRGASEFSFLPEGRERQPILLAKATLRWDLGSTLSVVGEAFYTHDPNRTVFQEGPVGVSELVLAPPSTVGFSAVLQARF
ncbi:hypothetical protein [Vitiosangium sp. GDMCC 1.1324]|uniref:hypothetical protein n=1 Tax=Vitiosangium sp. (strain GDMCC 1.1324) TaxID=2138576 RepID=UPI000D38F02F|nr:hypothetical protein [Vitiosangium sp. GDMCC 1.1324]PTL83309.1 hypothetical protein DAT35_15085 [Vitiosangium sp. GDMCC 1.1324]